MSTSKVSGRAYGVTGGASGLGEAVVTRLTRDGASCLVMDRDETRGAALAAANPRVLFVPTDVTSHESVAAAFAAALERFGRMDGVINCAGLGPTELTLSRDGKPHRPKLWDFVVKVNLYGVFNCASLGAQAMQRSRKYVEWGGTAKPLQRYTERRLKHTPSAGMPSSSTPRSFDESGAHSSMS